MSSGDTPVRAPRARRGLPGDATPIGRSAAAAKSPPGTPRARRGEDARLDLKDTAIDCFSRYGYHATSIDRIAREAGVTKGAIYYHYRDKEDLLSAAVADRVSAFEVRVQSACEGAGPAESLRRIAAVCVEHALSNDRPRFALKLMVEAIDTNDRVLEDMRGMMRRFRAFLRNVVRSGQECGDFDASADADDVAAMFTSAVIGAETQYHLDPERFSLERTLGTFLDRLCKDLAAAEGEREAQGRTKP